MHATVRNTIEAFWQNEALDALKNFIRLPAKSVGFDANWEKNGFLLQACEDAALWGQKHFPDATFEVLQEPGKSPALYFDISATDANTNSSVFFYGHFDKQPEGGGWTPPREAFTPVVENGKLYGRGGADDGYNFYAALTALHALDAAGIPRARAVGLYECAEECDSVDFEYWMKHVCSRFGRIGLVVVMDGTCCDYERLWTSVSFRGAISFTLNVNVLAHGVHSGIASGIVPESFTVARALLERIENARTGEITAPALTADIPIARVEQVLRCAEILGDRIYDDFPWAGTTHSKKNNPFSSLMFRSWKPQLCVTGAAGLPALENAGNVMRAGTSLRISIRIPPNVNPKNALDWVTQELTRNPPFGSTVTITHTGMGEGWNAPAEREWFTKAFDEASNELFGCPAGYCCEGASIPILSLMDQFFGDTQYLVTGVLGPDSNAHGPDEMLNLDYVKKVTGAVAHVIAAMKE